MSAKRNPTVSVIVPVYNSATTVEETLDSLLAQTFTDFEVLVIDDGSPDESIALVEAYDDPRIRIIQQDNRGLNGARNTGIRNSRGRYIAFLDADDLWRPQMLEKNIAHLEERIEIGISFSRSQLISEGGTPLPMRQRPKLNGITARDVICRNPLSNGSAGVFRREVFNGIAFVRSETPEGEIWWFDETFRQSTDIECWMRIVARTHWIFAGLPDVLVDYRVNSGGLSANIERQLMYWERAMAALTRIRPDLGEKYGRLARAYQYRYLARRAISCRDGRRALSLMSKAMNEDPRILFQEPSKTIATAAAALALRMLRAAIGRQQTVAAR